MALQLVIGNKNYSSWSMRPWVLMRTLRIPFEEQKLRFMPKIAAGELAGPGDGAAVGHGERVQDAAADGHRVVRQLLAGLRGHRPQPSRHVTGRQQSLVCHVEGARETGVVGCGGQQGERGGGSESRHADLHGSEGGFLA